MIHVETDEHGIGNSTIAGYGPRILTELACVISHVKEKLSEDLPVEKVNELLTAAFYLGMTDEAGREEEVNDNSGI